jgi:hypothetical protein
MGKLLSSAIKMQNVIVNPTLTINWNESYINGSVAVYKNGSLYGNATAGVPFVVPIVAGNTFYIVATPDPLAGAALYSYYVNDVFVASGYEENIPLTSATYTASGSNIYRFEVTTGLA